MIEITQFLRLIGLRNSKLISFLLFDLLMMHITELDVLPDNLDMVECNSGSSELSHITHGDNDGACFDSVNVPQTPDEPDAPLKDILLVLRDWKHELESGPVK